MKFAIFTHLPWPEDASQGEVIQRTTDQVQQAEALGFEGAWLAEHHFTRYSIGASPLVLATYLAARTSRIRLGTAVLVSPLHHPVRLAEDTATLDLVSDGRLDVGIGRGTFGYEYGGYHVDPAESQERLQESIKIIQGLWTTPDFCYQGRHFQVARANLVPTPVQQPHPPIYIAATRTPETLEFAVSTGHTLCVAVVQDTADALELCHRFVRMSREAGFNVPISRIPFFRYVYVAETEEQARRDTQARLNWVVDIMQWRRFIKEGSEVYQRMDDWRQRRTELPVSYDYLLEHRAIVGTPDHCARRIKELQAQGIDYFGCNFDFGGMPPQKVARSMDLFAQEVMPCFN
ncbi:MAG: LLM class flavin-dependent oxidoreductase [Dehalococcoidia bacterium]|nr:LLM class flavin-dependent oxidoreductase [Dehalococcoidia bacterium]MSQ16853.1 LLM class flavin-dependent oxidoreductase [Dehalococcoidia bacterium]